MYAANGPRGTSPRSFPVSSPNRSRGYRNPGVWANVRLACAIFDICLSVVMFSFGLWEGVFPLAAASVLLFRHILQHQVQR